MSFLGQRHVNGRQFGLLLAVLAVAGGSLSALHAIRPTLAQSGKQYFAPNLQIRGSAATGQSAAAAMAHRPAGMEGFGYSTLDLQNQSDLPNNVLIALQSRNYPSVTAGRTLAPRGATSVTMVEIPGTKNGNYWGVVNSGQPSRPIIRTTWPPHASGGVTSTAAAGLEAPEAGLELVLPLIVRGVQGFVTSYYVQNPLKATNYITMEIYNDADGSLEKSFTMVGEPEYTNEYELNEATFSRLPTNVGTGFVGAVYFRSNQPFAVMAYGDEAEGEGATSYAARPTTYADKQQYLPLVRANYLGDSYLTITNLEYKKASVTLTFRGAPDSPSGAGATFTHKLDVKARTSVFLDLGTRKRGTVAAPTLPRGDGLNTGFHGSAVIDSNTKILALAWDSAYDAVAATVRSSSAYNAFSPADLATALAVPRLHRDSGGLTSVLYLMNPGTSAAEVQIRQSNAEAAFQETASLTVPSGEARRWVYAGAPGTAQAELQSNVPIAALVYETAMLEAADWGLRWGHDAMAYAAIAMPGGALPTATIPPTALTPPTITPVPSQVATTAPTASPAPSSTPTARPTTGPDKWFIFLPVTYRGVPVGGQ